MAYLTTALAKNLLVLFALLLATILLFIYLALFPSHSTDPTPIDPLSIATFSLNTAAIQQLTPTTPSTTNLANLTGIPQLNDTLLTHTTLYKANTTNWHYSHYPILHLVNGSSQLLLAAWSSAPNDEDSDGERVVYTTVRTGAPPADGSRPSMTVGNQSVLFPSALLSGQQPSTYYDPSRLVRAMCPDAFVQLSDGTLYAVAELYGQSDVTGLPHEGTGLKGTGYGRVARQLSYVDGSIAGDVCWLQPSNYAPKALAGTPYDTTTAPTCVDADELLTMLSNPAHQPAWSWQLESDNHPVVAADGSGGLGEPTHAVAMGDNNQICRYWRSFGETVPLNHTLYIECTNSTASTDGWFTGVGDLNHRGNYSFASIIATNIPDANSKPFLGTFPATSGNARSTYKSFQSDANLTHYLITNPIPTPYGLTANRNPLTIATSIDRGITFNGIVAIRSNFTNTTFPGRLKNPGYQYPSAVIQSVGWINGTSSDVLYVLYSVNKEDVVLTSVSVNDLPRNVTGMMGSGGGDGFGKGFVFFILCVAAVVLIGAATHWVVQRGREGQLLDEKKWHSKKTPLVTNGKHIDGEVVEEEDEYTDEEEEEEGDEDAEYADEYEEQQVEEHKQPAVKGIVTSADVARMVTSQPTTGKGKRPVQLQV